MKFVTLKHFFVGKPVLSQAKASEFKIMFLISR